MWGGVSLSLCVHLSPSVYTSLCIRMHVYCNFTTGQHGQTLRFAKKPYGLTIHVLPFAKATSGKTPFALSEPQLPHLEDQRYLERKV